MQPLTAPTTKDDKKQGICQVELGNASLLFVCVSPLDERGIGAIPSTQTSRSPLFQLIKEASKYCAFHTISLTSTSSPSIFWTSLQFTVQELQKSNLENKARKSICQLTYRARECPRRIW